MVHQPRSVDTIKTQIEDDLKGSTPKLTGFFPDSLNDVWIEAFAEVIHQLDIRTLAFQLAGWPNYAGNTDLQTTDLEPLGIDTSTFDIDDLNSYMEEVHLDQLGTFFGVTRDAGQEATGQVTIQTASDTTRVYEGVEVSTTPDAGGDRQTFFVDANADGSIDPDTNDYVTPASGQTEVTVDIIASDVGTEYNVGAGTITRFVDPDVGLEGVNNTSETSGGEDRQGNEDLRDEIKNAIFTTAGGGTAAGIEGAIEGNVVGVSDVSIDEFFSEQPPYVDVIVDGGSDSDVQDEIDDSRPTGIEHNLVRPEEINVGVRTQLVGTDIDDTFVENEIEDYLLELTLDERFSRSVLINRIHQSEPDVEDVGDLTVLLTSVSTESEEYQSGTDIYELDFAPLGLVESDEHLFVSGTDTYELAYESVDTSTVTVTATVNGERTTLTGSGTDYNVNNPSGNTYEIDFSPAGTDPDDRTTFNVEYEHSSSSIDSTITDENGNTYDETTDWNLIDDDSDGLNDSIDWSIGGSSPSDGELFFVDYTPNRTIVDDLSTSIREKVSADGANLTVTTIEPA